MSAVSASWLLLQLGLWLTYHRRSPFASHVLEKLLDALAQHEAEHCDGVHKVCHHVCCLQLLLNCSY